MKRYRGISTLLLILLAGIFTVFLPTHLHAQETSLELMGGDTLTVEGEDFIYEKVLVEIDGVEVIQERAIWEGGVTAQFGEIKLETEHIEAIFDGTEVASLEAGPHVVLTGFNGRARFECGDVYIEFPLPGSDAESYRGVCRDVQGYYLAHASDLGLEGDEDFEVNFTANEVRLNPNEAILEFPVLSLGNLDDPDLAIQSREITFRFGNHPVTGERTVLGAEAANLSISLFGTRLNLIPFPIWRGFLDTRDPGFRIALPNLGWEGDEYLRIDQSFIYDFNDETVEEGPRIILRLDTFPFARTYPEIMADIEFNNLVAGIRTGYRREEDSEYEPIPTRAEPEIWLGTSHIPLDDSGLGFYGTTFWGHIRDMQTGLDLDRWGYNAILYHSGIPLGEFRLNGSLLFDDFFYESGENYRTLEGRCRIRYVDAPRWSASLTYRKILVWGQTPFRFDEPQIREEIGLRELTRFSRRWGAGFDWAWDFEEDDFERQECFLTYIFDSFQVSFGWDWANETAKFEVALPGSLK